MEPSKYLYKLARAVSKRSGICVVTCQVVIPALFDEMRYMLCEGQPRCVSVESFGSLVVKKTPSSRFNRRTPDGHVETVEIPSKLTVKYLPSRHMRLEVEQSKYDSTRHAFALHSDDHPLRTRRAVGSKTRKSTESNGIEGRTNGEEQQKCPQERVLGGN